jgi:hypothetical protein
MLIILIPAVWLSIAAFAVLLCRGAARADALAPHSNAESGPEPLLMRPGLVVYETQRGHDPRLRGRLATASAPTARAGGFRVRGVRGRGGRCVAGS